MEKGGLKKEKEEGMEKKTREIREEGKEKRRDKENKGRRNIYAKNNYAFTLRETKHFNY